MIIKVEWETVSRGEDTIELPDGLEPGEVTTEAVSHARGWDHAEDDTSREITHVSWATVGEKPGRAGSRRSGIGGL
jgi:hypothetical protein